MINEHSIEKLKLEEANEYIKYLEKKIEELKGKNYLLQKQLDRSEIPYDSMGDYSDTK